jgi:hypothetical protein
MRALVVSIVAVAVGVAAVAIAGAWRDGKERRHSLPSSSPQIVRPQPAPEPRETAVVLVRRRGGVPAAWVRRLRGTRSVAALAEISRTQILLVRSVTRDGRVVEAPRSGHAIPLDTLVIRPREYADVVSRAERLAIDMLRSGRVLLSRTAARLRGLTSGDRIVTSQGRSLCVHGVVADAVARHAGGRAAGGAAQCAGPRRHE